MPSATASTRALPPGAGAPAARTGSGALVTSSTKRGGDSTGAAPRRAVTVCALTPDARRKLHVTYTLRRINQRLVDEDRAKQ